MTKLYLVRHGETEENVKHILQGHMPGTLTQQGIEQAKEAVSQISDTAFDVCLCSDLKRCVDTVNILLEQRKDVPIIFTKLLRERDWGSITGVVVDREKGVEMPADVESLPAIRSRAKVFLDYVLQHYDGKNVLVVSHGFMLRIIQAVWRNVEHKEIVPMKNVEIRELVLCEE
jgi:probable phosphoglycerate mutase